ncbi:hypothetical protein PoB_004786700 [Plakobranchus ocellatus]|uniref:Uncharacterized protein n=1 Tax=Plakobranchus ocellatus TaxID=259542 RepID=A0AAV4BQW2_9GAST|nr:hypothetical protein PoB_004786700 [Plakobranchus ocellatus]
MLQVDRLPSLSSMFGNLSTFGGPKFTIRGAKRCRQSCLVAVQRHYRPSPDFRGVRRPAGVRDQKSDQYMAGGQGSSLEEIVISHGRGIRLMRTVPGSSLTQFTTAYENS